MNSLQLISKNGNFYADSREIAELIGKEHKNLIRDIVGYEHIISESSKLSPQDFFLKSSYKTEGNNKTYPCYLLTKKGCDMVANKLTGEKGVLFTAEYVSKFDEMEKQLANQVPKDLPTALRAYAQALEEKQRLQIENKIQAQQIAEFKPIKDYVDTILHSEDTVTTTQIAADYGLSAKKLNQILHEEKIQYKVDKQWILYASEMNKG